MRDVPRLRRCAAAARGVEAIAAALLPNILLAQSLSFSTANPARPGMAQPPFAIFFTAHSCAISGGSFVQADPTHWVRFGCKHAMSLRSQLRPPPPLPPPAAAAAPEAPLLNQWLLRSPITCRCWMRPPL